MTSLSTAGKIASSSLSATQVQLSVAAANIANADTEGYTKKTASQTSQSTSGVGTGVSVDAISSSVSRLLIGQYSTATSETAAAQQIANYLDQLQSTLGSTTSSDDAGTSLANSIADVETAMAELAATPESTSLANAVVVALESLTSQLNDLSSDIQSLRQSADSSLASNVEAANAAITTLDELNDQIAAATARGDSTADLEDARNSALIDLSQYVSITTFETSDGGLKVYTDSGQVLVDSTAHLFEFEATGSVTADTANDGSSSGLSGVTLDGIDLGSSQLGGSMGALLELRDEILTDAQEMVNELANRVITSVNSVREDMLTGTDASDISINSEIAADADTLLDATDPGEQATALIDALQNSVTFDAAGSLGSRTVSLADYAEDILAEVVSQTNSAAAALERTETELETVSSTISSLYGVNIDEETAHLSELEQLYSVSSQILSVIQDMFDDLIAAVQ